ncbi:MAG TPA: formate dehydrogenase accessory sulfurtransferase FdhD [Thermoanaerobaculia bacterium]|jgi:FdhD protein|nr:formate dehydrogenase accessory sulfurtransferase FdhD [Thermoanaerobaculia bacterium]
MRSKESQTEARIWRVEGEHAEPREDHLATEEPLEIRLAWGDSRSTVAVTMRTPGADAELAAGFLFAEGVIASAERIRGITTVDTNILEVELTDGPEPSLMSLDRHVFATSACGVCGKAGLETLRIRVPAPLPPGPVVAPELIRALPERLRAGQGLFDATGGLHAAALFDTAGTLLAVREDVGRHNALDKLMGWALSQGLPPLSRHLVMVSGRSSYEILQKSLVAGVAIVCAVSAPSSLAVELAERFGVTLIGFLRGDRFNIYSGAERIAGVAPDAVRPRRERLFPTVL